MSSIQSSVPPLPLDPDGVFTPEQEEAVIRVASHHMDTFEQAVIHFDPRIFDLVRSSVFKTFAPSAVSNLGELESFPSEILVSILCSLDISSGFSFSHVNRRAREVIASIWEYRQLSQHALECICAHLRTGVAHHVGIKTLYSALITKKCYLCNSFAGFLFLPTTMRCCNYCIETADDLGVFPLTKLDRFGRGFDEIGPVVISLQGTYALDVFHGGQMALVAEAHCHEIPLARSTFRRKPARRLWTYMALTSLPYYNIATKEIETGVSCKGCTWGAPQGELDPWSRRVRVYSQDEFVAHFKRCKEAKDIWFLRKIHKRWPPTYLLKPPT